MSEQIKVRFGKKLFTFLTLTLSVGFLLYILFTTDGITALGRILKTLQPFWLLCIAAAVAAGYFLECYVIHLFCRHLVPWWTFGRSFTAGMVNFLYSALTPFNAGEPVEVFTMNRMGMDTGAATSVITVKSLVHHGVMLVYSLVLVALKLHYFQTSVSNFSFLVLIGILTNSIFIAASLMFMISESTTDRILTTVLRILKKLHLIRSAEKLYGRLHGALMTFHDSSVRIGKAFSLYCKAVALTVVQITIGSLISYFIFRSFGLKGVSVFTMVAADTFVTMVSSFVPLPASSGAAEGSFYLFFSEAFGSAIIPAILLWRIATCYLNILCGCAVTYFGNRHYRKLAEKAAEKEGEAPPEP